MCFFGQIAPRRTSKRWLRRIVIVNRKSKISRFIILHLLNHINNIYINMECHNLRFSCIYTDKCRKRFHKSVVTETVLSQKSCQLKQQKASPWYCSKINIKKISWFILKRGKYESINAKLQIYNLSNCTASIWLLHYVYIYSIYLYTKILEF